MSEAELRTLLAHELGHIKCDSISVDFWRARKLSDWHLVQ